MAEGAGSLETQAILDRLTSNEVRLGEAISAVSQSYMTLEMRVRALEAKEQSNEVIRAREDERDKALYDRLGRMEEQIKETRVEIKVIKSAGTRALWIVGSAALSGITIFVVKAVLT